MEETAKKKPLTVNRLSPELQACARIEQIMSTLDEGEIGMVYEWFEQKYDIHRRDMVKKRENNQTKPYESVQI